MNSAPRTSMQVPPCIFCKQCACVALKNSAQVHRKPRGLRRKITRIFGAHRTAQSQQSVQLLQAVAVDRLVAVRMFCNRRACVSHRFCVKFNAKSRGFRRRKRKIFARRANVIIEGVNHRDFGTNNSNDVQNFRCFYSLHFHVFIVFLARMRKISSSCARNTICLQRDSKKSMFSERAKIVIFWWFSFKKNN